VSTLYLIATPIGNLEDITLRAMRVLGEVDALACEDTRRTRILFEKHGIKSPSLIFSYREHNEEQAGRRILGLINDGKSVGICSDAGYPGISDAGYRIVADAVEKGVHVEVIPGAGAVSVALLSSGLSTSSYTYKGFPPRKGGARRRFLSMEKDLPHTLVLFESPFRIGALLEDAYAVLGNRKAAVCLELTKKFEETSRGGLKDLAEKFKGKQPKGEITVVISGNNPKFLDEDDEAGGNDDDGE